MGLLSGNKQNTTTETNITNTSDDSTHLIQDSFNRISSQTTDISDAFKSSYQNTVSAPVSIIANGNGGASDSFDLNKFFGDTTLDASGSPVGASSGGPSKIGGFLAVVLIVAVGWFLYKRFKK